MYLQNFYRIDGDSMDKRIEQLINAKKKSKMTYEQIAEKSGVNLSTVQKVLGGKIASPRFETMEALEKILLTEEFSQLILSFFEINFVS